MVAIPPYFPCLPESLSLHSVSLSLFLSLCLSLSLSPSLSSSPFYLSPTPHYPKTELLALNKLLCCLLLNKTLISCGPLHPAVKRTITIPAQVVWTMTGTHTDRHRLVHSSLERSTNLCNTCVRANGTAARAGTQKQPRALLTTCGAKSSRVGVWKEKVPDMHRGYFSLLQHSGNESKISRIFSQGKCQDGRSANHQTTVHKWDTSCGEHWGEICVPSPISAMH